jgi:hypothetical protein
LGFQGKNLQDRAAEVVDVADGLANSGRQEDEVRGRQAGADNLPRAIAMNVLTLHLSKLRTSHIQISSNRLGNCLWPAVGENLPRSGTDYLEEVAKGRFVILSAAKDLVFLRFFGRFAPSE